MKKLFNIIFKNWFAKIICVLLAGVLWIYVGIGQTKNTDFPGGVPLQLRNVPAGLVAVTDVDKVSIRVVAESNVFQQLSAESFSAYLDLSGLSAGTYDAKVTAMAHVANVSVVEINPSKVAVRLETKAEKEVSVNCLIDGTAGEGLAPGLCEPTPAKVKVSGAKSVVNGLNEATARINLQGETADFKKTVKLVGLDANDKEIKSITFSPEEILVTVPIVKAATIKTIGIKVNTTGLPAEGFWISKIETNPATVTVTAGESIINQVNFIETNPVDVSNLNKNKKIEVTLKPSSGVVLIDKIEKIVVSLTVSKNQSTREIEAGFSWQNLSSNLKVTLAEPSSVKVVVTGPSDQLSNLTAGDISVIVDLSGLDVPGTHSVDISRASIAGPTGISVSSIVPSAINIRVDTK